VRKIFVYEGYLKPLKEVPDKWKKLAEEIQAVYKDSVNSHRTSLKENKLTEKK
jgi:hypothetical protein